MSGKPPSRYILQFGVRTALVTVALAAVTVDWNAPAMRRFFDKDLKLSPSPAEGKSYPPHYVRAIDALERNEIRPGMSVKELFAVSAPDDLQVLGKYTQCHYTAMVGYVGLGIIAKDQRLVKAVDSGCTYSNTFFDEMTSKDRVDYRKLVMDRYAAEDAADSQY